MESPNNPGFLQRIEEGQRIGNYFTFRYAGIDENGGWLVWNADGTEKIPSSQASLQADRRVTGNALPKFTASMTHSFNYKKWDLTLYFRGMFGYDLFNVHEFYYGLPTSFAAPIGNVMTTALEKNADITTGVNVLTDYFIERGDHVKLDMVNIGYRFDANNKWLDGVRVSVTGKNLFTFTKFSGIDPSAYQVNGLTPGLPYGGDWGSRRYYPSTRQVIFTVQLDF
jgi:hypothetical protein